MMSACRPFPRNSLYRVENQEERNHARKHYAGSEQIGAEATEKAAQQSPSSHATTILGIITIILLVTLLGVETHTRSSQKMPFLPLQIPAHGTATGCGQTASSALEAGCRFDPMSFSWLPPLCYDEELIATFLAIKPWHWYLRSSTSPSDEALQPVSFETVRQGGHEYMWVSREFHLFHCTYQWRKMHRAIMEGRPLDDYVGNYSHTEHCEHVLTKEVLELGLDVVDVQIQRKFVGCGGADGRNMELYRQVSN